MMIILTSQRWALIIRTAQQMAQRPSPSGTKMVTHSHMNMVTVSIRTHRSSQSKKCLKVLHPASSLAASLSSSKMILSIASSQVTASKSLVFIGRRQMSSWV